MKCCNCGGEHSAAYAGCPVQQQAREIQKVKSIQNWTYAEAARTVKQVAETRIQREQAQTSQTNESMKQLTLLKNDSTNSINMS